MKIHFKDSIVNNFNNQLYMYIPISTPLKEVLINIRFINSFSREMYTENCIHITVFQ